MHDNFIGLFLLPRLGALGPFDAAATAALMDVLRSADTLIWAWPIAAKESDSPTPIGPRHPIQSSPPSTLRVQCHVSVHELNRITTEPADPIESEQSEIQPRY